MPKSCVLLTVHNHAPYQVEIGCDGSGFGLVILTSALSANRQHYRPSINRSSSDIPPTGIRDCQRTLGTKPKESYRPAHRREGNRQVSTSLKTCGGVRLCKPNTKPYNGRAVCRPTKGSADDGRPVMRSKHVSNGR